MNKNELLMLQALPLVIKVAKSKLRIQEWVDYYGKENVYISFSGGKDSTVLLYLVREVCEDIPALFVDTGLEFPELKEFVKSFSNVEIIKLKEKSLNSITLLISMCHLFYTIKKAITVHGIFSSMMA